MKAASQNGIPMGRCLQCLPTATSRPVASSRRSSRQKASVLPTRSAHVLSRSLAPGAESVCVCVCVCVCRVV